MIWSTWSKDLGQRALTQAYSAICAHCMGKLHGRDYTYCRASDQKRQKRHCHCFRQRSSRFLTSQPDRLAIIRQENDIKATLRKKLLVKIFHRASELLLNCSCFRMVAKPSPPPSCSPAPPTRALMGAVGQWLPGPAAWPLLHHHLLVAGRGLAARAHPAPLPAGPIHPHCLLPDADRRLRGRGRHAPQSCRLLLSLGLADLGHPIWLSRRLNGTTVSVPAWSYLTCRIGWQLSVKRTR